jgi:hypothetical protein
MHFAIEGVSCMQHITERLAPFRCYVRDLDDPLFWSRFLLRGSADHQFPFSGAVCSGCCSLSHFPERA